MGWKRSHVTRTSRSVLDPRAGGCSEGHWSGTAKHNAALVEKRCSGSGLEDEMRMEAVHGHNVQSDSTYLNTIDETASEMNHKELIETPIWPKDIRNTQVSNIKKEVESPGPKDVRPITLAATLHCSWSSARYRESMTWAKQAWLHHCARRNPKSQSAECYLATLAEDGGHDKR